MAKELSESLEDYLEAIEELIAVDGHAHAKEIAAKLHVKMPSVTCALKQLEKSGHIVYNTHYPVQLTPKGKAVADEVMHRHAVLKKFFIDIIGLPLDKASVTACHLEHVVDADVINRFVLFSEAIEKRSDARMLQSYQSEAMSFFEDEELRSLRVLTAFAAGEAAIVKRIGRNLVLDAFCGVSVGDALTVSGLSLDRTMLRVLRNGRHLDLPLAVAENLWASPLSDADALDRSSNMEQSTKLVH